MRWATWSSAWRRWTTRWWKARKATRSRWPPRAAPRVPACLGASSTHHHHRQRHGDLVAHGRAAWRICRQRHGQLHGAPGRHAAGGRDGLDRSVISLPAAPPARTAYLRPASDAHWIRRSRLRCRPYNGHAVRSWLAELCRLDQHADLHQRWHGARWATWSSACAAIDDTLVEGPESYTVALASPGSTTGSAIALGTNSTVTTIIDNDTATWSLTGETSVTESAVNNPASYTVAWPARCSRARPPRSFESDQQHHQHGRQRPGHGSAI